MLEILFPIIFTVLVYATSVKINNKFKIFILNPVLLSTVILVSILTILDISYESYEVGGGYITYLLGPIVVLLAVPLYNSKTILKQNLFPILSGILSGVLASAVSVYVLSKMFRLNLDILLSLLPKSITAPMAIEASTMLGGIPGLTVVVVIFTGITGASLATLVMKYGRIENETAKGIGIGTASHGIGTVKAIEISQTSGAASGLAMGLTGLATVLLISIIAKVF